MADHQERPPAERHRQQTELANEIRGRIAYFSDEFDMSIVDVLGVLELVKLNMYKSTCEVQQREEAAGEDEG